MKSIPSINHLKEKLNGEIILPTDDNYDEARTIYNGMIDKRPEIIVKCLDAEDVIAAVQFARKECIEVSIRSGGHSGPGLALVDDGLVIDLSLMKSIQVDPENKTARVEPGYICVSPNYQALFRPCTSIQLMVLHTR